MLTRAIILLTVSMVSVQSNSLAQANLLKAGAHAINLGPAFTATDVQSYASASIGGTYAGRLDVAASYAILTRNIIHEVQGARTLSFSATYTFLRAEKSGMYAALQYSYGILHADVRDRRSGYPNYAFRPQTEYSSSYIFAAGRLPRDPTNFSLVPSLAFGLAYSSNPDRSRNAAMLIALELVFALPAGERLQLLPYLGIGKTNGLTVYSAGFRFLIPLTS